MALKRVIDDISDLAIEQSLIRKLPSLFPPDKAQGLEDSDIQSLAEESEEAVSDRARLRRKLEVLETGLRDLKRLDKHHALSQGECVHLVSLRTLRVLESLVN